MSWLRPASLSALAVLLLGGTLTAPAAAVPEPGDALTVELTAVEPVVARPDGEIVLTGSIVNVSDTTADGLAARLRLSPQPLISRSEVSAVVDQTTGRTGVPVPATQVPVADSLAPGAAAPFEIRAATNSLPWSENGVYALFVEATSDNLPSADSSIPVPWFPAPEVLEPSRIVVLNPVEDGVSLTAKGRLLTAQLPRSMAEGGGLAAAVSAGGQAAAAGVPITWVVDPAVTEAAERIASGTVALPDDLADPAAAAANVGDWLTGLTAAVEQPGSQAFSTPYADVDATALLANNLGYLVDEAIEAGAVTAASSLREVGGLLATPPTGTASLAALEAYAASNARAVVLSDAALPTTETLSYTPSGIDRRLVGGNELTAVIPDPLLTADLDRPTGNPAERFRAGQGLLADAAMITLELPTLARTVVLQPPPGVTLPSDWYASVLQDLAAAPWIDVVPLADLLAPGVPTAERELAPYNEPGSHLAADYLAPIPSLVGRVNAFSRVLLDPVAFEEGYRTAILRSCSSQWWQRPQSGADLLAAIEAELTADESKVTTISSGSITLSGSSGSLPLTIANDLDQPVEVGVILEADPAVRLAYSPPGLVLVEAGRRVGVEIPVELYGAGQLPVTVILTDRDGRPFISTADLVLRSTATTTIAAGIVVLGGLALVSLAAWRFRRKGMGPAE